MDFYAELTIMRVKVLAQKEIEAEVKRQDQSALEKVRRGGAREERLGKETEMVRAKVRENRPVETRETRRAERHQKKREIHRKRRGKVSQDTCLLYTSPSPRD